MSLTMVGGGFDSTKIRQGAELRQKATDLGLEDCVHFAGIQSPEAVAEYMRNSDILVSASRRETFGAVIVEALGSGIPVVATRCGGPEDIVTDAVGTLVEPEDAAALADGIEATAARLPAMDRFEIAAYAREHFSWDRTVDRYLDVYSRVATGS